MSKKTKYKLLCECGMEVTGFSEHHAKQNMKFHKMSANHNLLMTALKRQKEGKKS
jgi:hypothetical protein